jgi:hypothetical protein
MLGGELSPRELVQEGKCGCIDTEGILHCSMSAWEGTCSEAQ